MSGPVICSYCGVRVPAGTTCRNCGAPIPATAVPADAPVDLRAACAPFEDPERCVPVEALSDRRRQRALAALAIPSDDELLVFCDGTVFGSAKYGFGICRLGLRWKNDWSTPTTRRFLPWAEFAERTVVREGYHIDLGRGDRLDVSAYGFDARRDRAVAMLQAIGDRLRGRSDDRDPP